MTGPGSSTFVVVDFFDYESQTTSLLPGTAPALSPQRLDTRACSFYLRWTHSAEDRGIICALSSLTLPSSTSTTPDLSLPQTTYHGSYSS